MGVSPTIFCNELKSTAIYKKDFEKKLQKATQIYIYMHWISLKGYFKNSLATYKKGTWDFPWTIQKATNKK